MVKGLDMQLGTGTDRVPESQDHAVVLEDCLRPAKLNRTIVYKGTRSDILKDSTKIREIQQIMQSGVEVYIIFNKSEAQVNRQLNEESCVSIMRCISQKDIEIASGGSNTGDLLSKMPYCQYEYYAIFIGVKP